MGVEGPTVVLAFAFFGPVLRLDKVFIEGNASGSTTVAGAVATVRLSRTYAVEAEITQASGRIARSYEGWFVSYATSPNASREEMTPRRAERLIR